MPSPPDVTAVASIDRGARRMAAALDGISPGALAHVATMAATGFETGIAVARALTQIRLRGRDATAADMTTTTAIAIRGLRR